MAVTPGSLLALSTVEQNIVARGEAAIDAELRLKYVEGKPVAIRQAIIDFVLKENPRVLDTLLGLYLAAGWEIVDYEKDGRVWYSFTEA